MISIVLVDDHPLAVKGIGAWLQGTKSNGESRFTIVGTAGNLEEAGSLLEKLDPLPDIIILDISLGAEDGLDFIPVLKEICTKRKAPLPGILVCSMYEDPFLIQRAVDAGAAAYVSKSEESGEIIAAIEAVMDGQTYINDKYRIHNPELWTFLSRRENEIVSMVRRSMNNQQIAEQLGLSIRTVENHLARIYVKTGALSRRDLFDLH